MLSLRLNTVEREVGQADRTTYHTLAFACMEFFVDRWGASNSLEKFHMYSSLNTVKFLLGHANVS